MNSKGVWVAKAKVLKSLDILLYLICHLSEADACKTIELCSIDDYNIKKKYFTEVCMKDSGCVNPVY